jgi:hypothetical protein
MSSFTRAYSSRARIGKAQAKVALAAARTSDQDIPDQNDPSPDAHRLFNDAAAGRKTPRLRGGHESVGNSSEGGESPKDLDAERSDDQEDQTPDQNLNRWTSQNPNAIRIYRELGLLLPSETDGIENPKVDKNPNQRANSAEAHTVDLGPSNWEDKDLDEEEHNLEAQQTALDSLKQDFLRKKAARAENKAELMALGKCFICKETGHLVRDFPGENAENSSSSENPGVSNFGIGFEDMDEEDSDEVENLSTLRVSAVSFLSSGISPEERNITSGMPDWGAENDIIIPADHRSTPSNDHILDLVPEMTGIP